MVSKESPAARVRWLIAPISDSASATDSSNSLSLVSRSITGVFMLPVFWTDKIPALQQLRIAAHFLRASFKFGEIPKVVCVADARVRLPPLLLACENGGTTSTNIARLQRQRFIQAVVTTMEQALRRLRGPFELFLPREVHLRFRRVNELFLFHRAVLQRSDGLGCHCSSHEVVPPNN